MKKRIWGAAAVVIVLVGAWIIYMQWQGTASDMPVASEDQSSEAESSQVLSQEIAERLAIVDFRMLDLDNGWFRDVDGMTMVTADGGASWQEAGPDWSESADMEAVEVSLTSDQPVIFNGETITVQQSQPVSGKIGWVLAAEESGLAMPLLITVDGGDSWHDEVTANIQMAIAAEKVQQELRAEEVELYESPQLAAQVIQPESPSGWILIPDRTYPGDVVLVRRNEPGELEWQDKTYTLQQYKAGYFTYLPIPRTTEPGTYRIGDRELIVEEKEFKTQHLNVTQEMEDMRRNTERIQADQVKVEAARSESEATFLFDSAFIAPVEGRLTTPFGYTRYVNGKLSSSHMAIDLAAPEGTPLKATNDGIVALAEELYLTGNAIYLDHGMGLFSQYAHLSELHVKPGDKVKKGDIIGLVGTTGFSTGPHLHFTFWAHNIPVNPDLFFETTPFLWLTEHEEAALE